MNWIELRRAFHRIPELGFQEVKTQQLILDTIAKMPQARLTVRKWKTGVIVRVRGKSSYTIGYRADIDGLPIHEETGYSFSSTHEGAMHACGHDFHMTIALGILRHFSEVEPPCQLVFIFQPAEEGPGGAKPILAEGVLKDCWPDEIYALHIDPTSPVGTVSTKPGLLFAHTSELFIDFHGQGGHAAYPHKANDMVVAAAHFVTQLQTIVARNIDPLSAAVVTIGVIQGGVKQNVIAEKARIEGTIRTLSETAMTTVKARIEALTKGVEVSFGCKTATDYGANYCGVNNDATLVQDFRTFTESVERIAYREAEVAMTGEDFGYFLKEIPGLMFWLGVDSPYGLHDARLAPKEEAIEIAVQHMIGFLGTRKG